MNKLQFESQLQLQLKHKLQLHPAMRDGVSTHLNTVRVHTIKYSEAHNWVLWWSREQMRLLQFNQHVQFETQLALLLGWLQFKLHFELQHKPQLLF